MFQFKRLLDRELSQLAVSSKSGSQISEYIHSTFLGRPIHCSCYIFNAICIAKWIARPLAQSSLKISFPFSVKKTRNSYFIPSHRRRPRVRITKRLLWQVVDHCPPAASQLCCKLFSATVTCHKQDSTSDADDNVSQTWRILHIFMSLVYASLGY